MRLSPEALLAMEIEMRPVTPELIRETFDWMVERIHSGNGVVTETCLPDEVMSALYVYMMDQTAENLSLARKALELSLVGAFNETDIVNDIEAMEEM